MGKSKIKPLKKLVLIDGNSLLYRAFFALPPTLTTSAGVLTNAVYGFVSMIIKLIEQERPYGLAVAWDKGKPHRLDEYEEYKAHRKPTATELIGQFPVAREVLTALRIPAFELEGYEADDILATMATEAEKKGFDVIIVTGDRDAFQLIDDHIKVMTTRKGITDIVLYDKKQLDERYGIKPELVVDMLGLKGDPSDNIPGVPGIGEKTAIKLVQEFGTIENMIANIDKITPTRAKNMLEQHKDQALLSKRLAILLRDLEIGADYEALKWQGPDEKATREVFTALEFKTLIDRLFKVIKPEQELTIPKVHFEEVDIGWLKLKLAGRPISIYPFEEPRCIALCDGSQNYVYKGKFSAEDMADLAKAASLVILPDSKEFMRMFNIKDSRQLGKIFDIAIAAYINDPSFGDYRLNALAPYYLKFDIPEEMEIQEGYALHAQLSFELYKILEKELRKNDLTNLYENIELPLVDVLLHMERRGVKIDAGLLKSLSAEMSEKLKTLTEEIYAYAGGEFNINSTQQLSEVLFDKLGLKPTKKTKTGLSTSASTLATMVESHPIIKLILKYRELAKLKGTYVDSIPSLVEQKTSRLYTTFHQTVTATGRISSTNPNMQNIPVRTKLGRKIREAFVAASREDNLLVADYSQIELRILAHISKDQALINSFMAGEDIHRRTASEVFQLPLEEVDEHHRRKAKAVNFGIVYGISARGLAEQLGVLPEEAKEYINKYFERYPGVKSYMETAVETAYKQGFVQTIFNRRRYLPELKSSNFRVRSFGERLAINTPIQGSAADIIKVAMLNIHQMLHDKGTRSEMILQVHDELVFELCKNEEYLIPEISRLMTKVYPLEPKLEVNLSIGHNWHYLKEIKIEDK